MRKTALAAFIVLLAPVLSAAVLPFDSATRAGGSRRFVEGQPAQAGLQMSAAYRGDWSADALNTWRGDDGEPRVQFNLRSSAGDSRWGFGVRVRDLAGLPPAALANAASDVQFSWTKEAGTFRFTGSFDQGRGHGTYTFTPDQAFVTNMASSGYKSLSTDDMIRLAVIDVTIAHVRGLTQASYANLSLDDVIRTRIHGVTADYVKAMQALGIRGSSIDDLVRFRIHKVTPEFIQALDARGYKNVPADDLVKMRIHNVTPEEIDRFKTLGFGGLSIDDLVKFRIHKVTPDFIRSMRDLGFVTISADQLVRLRIHNVDAQFIKDARADGLAVQTAGDAVDLAIHGPRWRKRG
jgi:hypothetical protein